jgi:hypothetical protein
MKRKVGLSMKRSVGFEGAFSRILDRKEKGKPETRGRKKKPREADLGNTDSGRTIATGPPAFKYGRQSR